MIFILIIFNIIVLISPTNFCQYFDLLNNTLKENSVHNMTFVMYHENVFYMRDQKFGKSFILLSDMIKEYCCIDLHPYVPHKDEICLGLFPGIFLNAYQVIVIFIKRKNIYLINFRWYVVQNSM